MCARSMSATLRPALAKATAKGEPAWPEPIMVVLKCDAEDMVRLRIMYGSE